MSLCEWICIININKINRKYGLYEIQLRKSESLKDKLRWKVILLKILHLELLTILVLMSLSKNYYYIFLFHIHNDSLLWAYNFFKYSHLPFFY